MDYEKTKDIKLRSILKLFMSIIKKASASDDFDYTDDPVDSHTDWDYIPDDSVRVVYSISGPHHPDIRSHNYNQHYGVVITFDAELGGNNQIFLSRSVLALRQIGNPAGWSYLGLNGNQKIYIDQDTAEVLNNIVGHAHRAGLINDESNQRVGGDKDFLNIPTYQGDPLVTSSQLNAVKRANHKTDVIVNDNKDALTDASASVAENTEAVEDLASSANSFATKSELSNYTPLNQLRFYATKKQIDDVMDNYGVLGIKETIHRMNLRFNDLQAKVGMIKDQNTSQSNTSSVQPKMPDLNPIKNAITTMNSNYNDLHKLVDGNKAVNSKEYQALKNELETNVISINQQLKSIDLNKVKATIHKINLRAQQQNSQVKSVVASASNFASGISTNAKRANSADVRFAQLNQHNKKADNRYVNTVHQYSVLSSNFNSHVTSGSNAVAKLNADNSAMSSTVNKVSASANQFSVGISENALRLNSGDTRFYQLNQHNKKQDKIAANNTKSLSSYSAILTNHADNINHLNISMSTLYGKLPADIQSNAKGININGNALSGINNNIASLSTSANAGISANASRLNSNATDTYNLKQHIKKANKRYTDAINSLKAGHISPANSTNVASLSNTVSVLSDNTKIDIQSLANKIKSVASDSADSKINSVVTSDKAIIASQSNTNNSLSNAIVTNSQKTSNVESALISALSKNQLR